MRYLFRFLDKNFILKEGVVVSAILSRIIFLLIFALKIILNWHFFKFITLAIFTERPTLYQTSFALAAYRAVTEKRAYFGVVSQYLADTLFWVLIKAHFFRINFRSEAFSSLISNWNIFRIKFFTSYRKGWLKGSASLLERL